MQNTDILFDVVIPAHEKDSATLNFCISAIKKNIINHRRIIVVSKDKLTDKAEWFSEKKFPFSLNDLINIYPKSSGWHLQQLLKLYSPLVIPNILPNVLIIDSDTIFFNKTSFFDQSGVALYSESKDKNLEKSTFHQKSCEHIFKLLPSIKTKLPQKYNKISGICHHMIFQKNIIEDLFQKIQKQHNTLDPFYKIFMQKIDDGYEVSEYNLYFYFLITHYPQRMVIRNLKYKNTSNLSLWRYKIFKKYDYCSFHSYQRNIKNNLLKRLILAK
jgi:hypothetical protein